MVDDKDNESLDLVIKVMDISLEGDKNCQLTFNQKEKDEMDMYIFVGEKEYGKLNINGEANQIIAVPLEAISTDNKLKIVLQITHKQMVSVSITKNNLMTANAGIVDQRITFFYQMKDDEYDGRLDGDPDIEDPSVRLLFLIQGRRQVDQVSQQAVNEEKDYKLKFDWDFIYQREAILMSKYPERYMIKVNDKMEPLRF